MQAMRDIEEALVAVHDLWWRSPGQGSWPFAGDGPWHLIQAERGDMAGDVSEDIHLTTLGREMRVLAVESRRPRTPLSTAEVRQRDKVTAWLQLLPDELSRKIVWLGTLDLARGEPAPAWQQMARDCRVSLSGEAMRKRYPKALAAIVCRLVGWPVDGVKAKRMAAEYLPSWAFRR